MVRFNPRWLLTQRCDEGGLESREKLWVLWPPLHSDSMVNVTAPFEAAFELQRESIKQSQQLVEQGLDIQQNAAETTMRNGLAVQRAAQRRSADLARQLFDAQVEAVDSALDENEDTVRAAVDRQFEEFEEVQTEAWDEYEANMLDAIDDLSVQQKEVVAQSVGAFLEAQRETEQQTVEGVQRVEAQADTQTRAIEQLEDLEGVGATYTERLRENGIESITDLARANAETVTDAADVTRDQADEWIQMAQAQVQSQS